MGLNLFICINFADDLIYFAFVPWCISPRNTITSHEKYLLEMKIHFPPWQCLRQDPLDLFLNKKVNKSIIYPLCI